MMDTVDLLLVHFEGRDSHTLGPTRCMSTTAANLWEQISRFRHRVLVRMLQVNLNNELP